LNDEYIDGVVDSDVGGKVYVHGVVFPLHLAPHYPLLLVLADHLNRQERVYSPLRIIGLVEERNDGDSSDEGFIDDYGELDLEVEVFE